MWGWGLGPHLTQYMAWAEVYLSTKWHFDPSSRLATTDMGRKLWGIYDQFSANVRCGQTAGWTKMPLRVEVGLGPGDVVLDGVAAPPKRGTAPSQFSVHIYCGQTAGWIKMPLDTELGLGPGHIVLDGHPAPLPKKGQFLAHVYCGQTAGWINMPLGTEIGLGPDHILLDGDSAPLPTKRGQSPPIFGPCLLWPNG